MNRDIAELAEAIEAARGGDRWRTVTVLTPSQVCGLQTRRQLVRSRGALANVQWRTPTDLLAAGKIPPSQNVQIATAWRNIQEPFAEWLGYLDNAEILTRAFSAMQRLLAEPEMPTDIDERVRLAFQGFCDDLPGLVRPGQNPLPVPPGTVSFRMDPDDRRIATAPGNITDSESIPSVSAVEAHDTFDEISLALRAVREALLDGVPAYRCGIIVPDRAFYGRLTLEMAGRAGLILNGMDLLPAVSPEGRALRKRLPLVEPSSWAALIAGLTEEEDLSQPVRDRLRDWEELHELDVPPAAPLVKVLLTNLLNSKLPGGNQFGDGIFVSTLAGMEGLDFERLFVIGFTDRNFPRRETGNPLLPRSLRRNEDRQMEKAFDRLANRCGQTVVFYSRGDRKTGQPAFASPWLSPRLSTPVQIVASRTALLQKEAPLTREELMIAQSSHRGPSSPSENLMSRSFHRLPSEGLVSVPPSELFPAAGWSPSRLESYLACSRRYYYERSLKLPDLRPDEVGLPPTLRGEIAHRLLQELFQNNIQSLSDPDFRWDELHKAEIRMAIEDHRYGELIGESVGHRRDARQLADEIGRLLDRDSDSRADGRWVPAQFEKSFSLEIEGIPVRGRIDRIDTASGNAKRVIDYKSGKVDKFSEKKEPTNGGRRLQWMIYAEAADPGSTVEATYMSLRGGNDASILYGDDQRKQLYAWVRIAGRMADEGLIPLRPGVECRTCPFTAICPADRVAIAAQQREEATSAYRDFLEQCNDAGSDTDGEDNDE